MHTFVVNSNLSSFLQKEWSPVNKTALSSIGRSFCVYRLKLISRFFCGKSHLVKKMVFTSHCNMLFWLEFAFFWKGHSRVKQPPWHWLYLEEKNTIQWKRLNVITNNVIIQLMWSNWPRLIFHLYSKLKIHHCLKFEISVRAVFLNKISKSSYYLFFPSLKLALLTYLNQPHLETTQTTSACILLFTQLKHTT